jgi:hypothetical protein
LVGDPLVQRKTPGCQPLPHGDKKTQQGERPQKCCPKHRRDFGGSKKKVERGVDFVNLRLR